MPQTNSMNTQEKRIEAVANAMTTKERTPGDDDTRFYHFKDEAPKELKDIFLNSFEVRDLDYEIFSKACDDVAEVDLRDLEGYDFTGEFASVYTSDRLSYLNNNNQQDISEYCQNYKVDIATACAIWYDEQVNTACYIIREWVLNGTN